MLVPYEVANDRFVMWELGACGTSVFRRANAYRAYWALRCDWLLWEVTSQAIGDFCVQSHLVKWICTTGRSFTIRKLLVNNSVKSLKTVKDLEMGEHM